jgi:hypothetical protein
MTQRPDFLLEKTLAADHGAGRKQMKAIGYLGLLDQL